MGRILRKNHKGGDYRMIEKYFPKHETICPKCSKKIIDDCWGCISGKMLACMHKNTDIKTEEDGAPDFFEDIKWTPVSH